MAGEEGEEPLANFFWEPVHLVFETNGQSRWLSSSFARTGTCVHSLTGRMTHVTGSNRRQLLRILQIGSAELITDGCVH